MKDINYKGKNMKDISGMQSGFLVAIEPTKKRIMYGADSRVVWKCLCNNPEHETPVFCEATTTDITTGNKTSCGCIKSKGEMSIINLLTQNNVFYEKEKKFEGCKSKKGYFYRFDFYVNNQYLIEFDGEQHYKPVKYGNMNDEEANKILERTQKYDLLKNEYCKENNINLLRIPYWEKKNIEEIIYNCLQRLSEKDFVA